jgi:MFS family permease
MGGFALPTSTIGAILSAQGIIQMFVTIVVFPWVNKRIGNLWCYRCAVFFYPFLYFVVPYVTLLPESLKWPAIYVILVWKVTSQAFAFPSSSIMLANAAPSSKVLGTLNGTAGSAASGARAIGPTLAGLMQTAGLSINTLGLPWWINSCVAVIGAIVGMCMVVEDKRCDAATEKAATNDCSTRGLDGDESERAAAQSSEDASDRLLVVSEQADDSTASAEKSN